MRKGIAAAVIVTIVIVGLIVMLMIGDREAEAPSQTNESTTQDSENADNSEEEAQGTVESIGYTDQGFVKAENKKIKAGGSLTILNQSTRTLDFASDDHPSHTENSELNVGEIEPGESKTVVLNTKGEWGYHNHDFASHSGVITVE